MVSLNNAKSFKRGILKRNVTSFLAENYDWRVSKAISTGQPLSDADKQYRASIVAEYHSRVEQLNAATTIEQVNSVNLSF